MTDHVRPCLLIDREATTFVDNPEKGEVRWATVLCPDPHHLAGEIFVSEKGAWTRPSGVNVWCVTFIKNGEPIPNLGEPGLIHIHPSIGLHMVAGHDARCHLGPGDLTFYWVEREVLT